MRDNQSFLSLYYEPNAVEFATGELDSFALAESWQREAKQMGRVATPEPVAAVMAQWVMSPKPRTLLDPAAGLGGLLTVCRQFNERVELVGVERDVQTLQRAKSTAPRGAKLILADYLKSETGLFDGIIANPPYVKAQRLDYSEKDWRYFEERFGTPAAGSSSKPPPCGTTYASCRPSSITRCFAVNVGMAVHRPICAPPVMGIMMVAFS